MDSTPPPGAPLGTSPNTAAPHDQPGATSPRGSAFFDSLRRSGLARGQDRWIGGVASGIAARLGIDAAIVRGAFVVLSLFGGVAVVVYGLGWALLPEASDGRIHLEDAVRGRFDAALAGATAFVLVGLSRPTFWFNAERWLPDPLLALAWLGVVATVVVLAVMALRGSRKPGPPRPPHAPVPQDARGSAPSGWDAPTPYPAARPLDVRTPSPGAPPHPSTPYDPPGTRTWDAPPPVQTAWQAPPRRARTPGPGSATVMVVLALALLGGAGVLAGHEAGLLAGNAALAAAGGALILLGLGSLLSGIRGRRAGALGVLGVLLAMLAVPAAIVTTTAPQWRAAVFDGNFSIADGITWAPTSVAEAEEGYSYSVGEARIDLTGPPWSASADEAPATVRIAAGAGSTTVVVPSGVALEVRTELGAGDIRSTVGPGWTRIPDLIHDQSATGTASRGEGSGTDLALTLRSPEADTGPLALVVIIDAALGDVIIEEVGR